MSRYSETLTFETILNEMLSQVPDTVDKREGSVIYDALAPAAMELAQVYILLDVILDETFVDTASLQYLMKRAAEIGVPIQEATQAVVRGEFKPESLEIPEGSRFNCGSVNYVVDEKISDEDGGYRLTCETAGPAGDLTSGVLLPIDSIQGLETAKITCVLSPAVEADNADTLRERYYKYVRYRAYGGNISYYKQRLEFPDEEVDLSEVWGVKVRPVPEGAGTVELTVIALDTDSDTHEIDYRAPSPALVSKVQEVVDPVGHQGEGRGIAPIGHTVTVNGVREHDIIIRCLLVYKDGKTWDDVGAKVKKAVRDYFLELRKTWKDQEKTEIRISYIERAILSVEGIEDVTKTSINYNRRNFDLLYDQIPVLAGEEVIPLNTENEENQT